MSTGRRAQGVNRTNIREADGRLNNARAGEVVFWQTREPGPK